MVTVDAKKCIGCGACAATCPSCFEMKGGKAHVKAKCTGNCVRDAADGCPVNAIKA